MPGLLDGRHLFLQERLTVCDSKKPVLALSQVLNRQTVRDAALQNRCVCADNLMLLMAPPHTLIKGARVVPHVANQNGPAIPHSRLHICSPAAYLAPGGTTKLCHARQVSCHEKKHLCQVCLAMSCLGSSAAGTTVPFSELNNAAGTSDRAPAGPATLIHDADPVTDDGVDVLPRHGPGPPQRPVFIRTVRLPPRNQ